MNNLLPEQSNKQDLGNNTHRWKELNINKIINHKDYIRIYLAGKNIPTWESDYPYIDIYEDHVVINHDYEIYNSLDDTYDLKPDIKDLCKSNGLRIEETGTSLPAKFVSCYSDKQDRVKYMTATVTGDIMINDESYKKKSAVGCFTLLDSSFYLDYERHLFGIGNLKIKNYDDKYADDFIQISDKKWNFIIGSGESYLIGIDTDNNLYDICEDRLLYENVLSCSLDDQKNICFVDSNNDLYYWYNHSPIPIKLDNFFNIKDAQLCPSMKTILIQTLDNNIKTYDLISEKTYDYLIDFDKNELLFDRSINSIKKIKTNKKSISKNFSFAIQDENNYLYFYGKAGKSKIDSNKYYDFDICPAAIFATLLNS